VIAELLTRHRRVAFDSNILIYLFEGTGELADKVSELLDALEVSDSDGVLSALALTEVCTGPARAGDLALVERYADEIQSITRVRVVPLSADIAVDAAVLRGGGPMSMADAIHLATARSAGATLFITNDRRIKPTVRLEVAYLDQI
jgi:Predicted nucleic acid-binding protein, contains PIN domain